MNANELADLIECACCAYQKEAGAMLRQQQAEIEDLKSANRFIQNFAEEQHKRAVALEMRELTDEEIKQIFQEQTGFYFDDNPADDLALMDFARAILRKAQEK